MWHPPKSPHDLLQESLWPDEWNDPTLNKYHAFLQEKHGEN